MGTTTKEQTTTTSYADIIHGNGGEKDPRTLSPAEQQYHEMMMYQHMILQQPIFGYPIDPSSWHAQQQQEQQQHEAAMQEQHYAHQYNRYHRQLPIQQLQAQAHGVTTMEGVPLPPGIPGLGGSTDPLEAVLGPFPCVRLKNLPFDATLEDILVLFQGLVVLDVLIVGQGEAFVLFANPMDFQMAMQRDRQTIGRRFVEVSQGSRNEYYEAIATQQMKEQQPQKPMAGDGGAKPTGPGGSQQDSSAMWASSAPGLGFFQPQREKGDQHQGGADLMGGRGHIGMMPGMGMGSGGVGGPEMGLGSSGMPGVGAGGRPAIPPAKRTGGGIQIGDHTGFLRMRGLPFSSTKDEIFKFFDGYNPVPDSIVLTYRSDGRATGEAYVGFVSPDDSKKAMDLHRKSMGNRYIELFISNKDEHGRALQRFGNR